MTKFLNISTDTTLGGNAPSDELAVSQKAIKTYVDNHGGGGSVAIDNSTITKNLSDEIQAVAVIDQNSGIAKTWTGIMAEYDAIVTKDPETEYIITDDIGGSATEIGQITEALNEKVDKGFDIIEFQEPTAANNYTWYKKYRNGWVEQGGIISSIGSGSAKTATLPIAMSDVNYTLVATSNGAYYAAAEANNSAVKTSTTVITVSNGSHNICDFSWIVQGMAA